MNIYTKKIKKLQEGIDKLKSERNAKILELRNKGLTFNKIGGIFDMSSESIRKILKKKTT
ncbi:MAG TPA: hypothetical protein DDY52_03235 [Candidatus Moranbacteria bacterium]|nr:hypothetical protein [Candidatus Moranbacteria bacterium]